MPKSGAPFPHRPVVEALEPKLLYSADLGVTAFAPQEDTAYSQTLASMAVMDSRADLIQQGVREIAFVDASVTDAAGLVADIRQQASQGRSIEVIVIRSDEDGLARITEALQGRQDVAAIHLIGHGHSGGMQLGTAGLDAQSLMSRAGDIAQWGHALGADGDLLLYGCDVALGTPGHDLVEGLASLTGADVAGSDDPTGAALLGGDWDLEVATGQIDNAVAIGQGMQAQWQALLAPATPGTKGTAIWSQNGDAAPQQGAWDGLTLDNQTNTSTLGSAWKTMASADSPTRDETIAIGVDASGTIRAQRWDGTQWTPLAGNPLGTGTPSDRQGFAVAYEQSGDAVLVWNNGTSLRYSVFNGTTWTTASAIGAYTGAIPQRMRLAANPKGDGMVLVVSDSNGDDFAMAWNGSAWGNAVTLDTTGTGVNDQISMDVAYEGLSGRAIVTYAKAGNANVYYRIFNGTGWTAEAAVGNFGEAASPFWVTLASDPRTNRIGLGFLSIGASNTDQVSLAVWDGSAWGTRLVAGTYTDAAPGSNVALAFESQSGDLLAVYGDTDSAVRYRTWTSAGGWSGQSTGPTVGTPGAVRLYTDPSTNHIMMGVQSESGQVSFTDWNGSAFAGTTVATTNSGSTVTPAFGWSWRRDLSGNKTNTLLVGSATDATGWRGVNGVSDGEVLKLTDPGLSYGDGSTHGSFSHVVNFEAMGAQGVDDIIVVSRDLTITSGIAIARGDILLTTTNASTLVNADGSTLAVAYDDVVRFRPSVAGDYSQGTFTILVKSLGSSQLLIGAVVTRGGNVRGLALVEQSTTVAGVTLDAGTLLFTADTLSDGTAASASIRYLKMGDAGLLGGLLVGANATELIKGSNVNINQAITGLEVIGASTPMANTTLNAGQLLFSLGAADNNVGNTGAVIGMNAGDVGVLTATSASQATATILLRGSQVGATQAIDSLAIQLDNAPTITSNSGGTTATVSVAEGATAVTTVTATDLDGDKLAYSITGGADARRFQINATTGALTFVSAMDYEDPVSAANSNAYQVIVTVSDGTYTDVQTITANVTNVNEAPVLQVPPGMSSVFGFNILNIPMGAANLLTIRASDPEGQAITYSLEGLSASSFTVNASTGAVKLKSAANQQDGDDYMVTLVATDASGARATLGLILQVQAGTSASNDYAPDISGGSARTISVPEAQTYVTTVQAADNDYNASLTYSITSSSRWSGGSWNNGSGSWGNNDTSLFQINAVTGELRFQNAPIYDSSQSTYQVTVKVTDGTYTDTQTITVNVLDHNDAPANTLPSQYATNEDNAVSLTGISVADPDAGTGSVTVTFSVRHGTLTALNSVGGGVGSGGIAYANGNRQVTLTGTLAAINATLANANGLRYQADGNYAGTDTLTMVSNDQGNSGLAYTPAATTDTDTALIVVKPSNDAAVAMASTGSLSYTENSPATVIDPAIALNDVDGASITSATVSITGNYASGQDVLGFVNQSGITGSWNAATGTLTLTGNATIAAWQNVLRAVTYHNTSDNPGTAARAVTFTVIDSGTPVSATRTIAVTAVNDAPVMTGSAGTLAYTENAPATAVDPGLTVGDLDSAGFTGATVRITGNHASAEDVLGFVNQNGITGAWNASTGTLTLSGTASVANYQAALRSVTYRNSSDNPGTATRTVTFSVTDSGTTVTSTRDIAVTAANDAPLLATTPSPQTHTLGGAPTVIDATLTLADPDTATLSGAVIRISNNYDQTDDQLDFTSYGGITGHWNNGQGILTLSGTASVADYQAALRSVTFVDNSLLVTSMADRTITFTVNDGSGDVSASRVLQIALANNAPVLATTGTTLAYTEGGTTPVDTGLSLSDNDSASLTLARVRIAGHYVDGQDELVFTDQLGLTGSWDAATGTLTLTGNASVADFETALRTVSYRNTSDAPDTAGRTVTFTVVDGGNSVSASRAIAVSAVNDGPTLATSGGTLNYAENDAATPIDPGLVAGDPDTAAITGATVQITGHYVTGQDVLGFAGLSGIPGITGSWDATTGTLTLSGNASPADYQAALRAVIYRNTSDAPDTGLRTVTFAIGDGSLSATATQDIAVTAAVDAAVVTASPAPLDYTEGTPPSAIDPGLTLADADSTHLIGAIVQITGNYFGDQDELRFTDQSGITGTWDATSGTLVLSGTATVADYQAALRSVTYGNGSTEPDLSTRTVTFTVDDGSATGSATRDIAVLQANDPPVLTAGSGDTPYTEGMPDVAVDPALTLTDVDDTTLTGATVRITGHYTPGQDVLGFAGLSGVPGLTGTWDAATGTLTLSGSAGVADYEAALRAVTYRNTSDRPDTAARAVTFTVSDGTSTVSAVKGVQVEAVNDAPVITTTGGALGYTENGPATVIDAGLTVSDADTGGSYIGATVQITGNYVLAEDLLGFTPQNGIISNWDADTGTLTLMGNASLTQYQAALRSITYRNTSDNPGTATRTVTFSFSDGTDVGSGTRDIAITAVNDAPVISATPAPLVYTENDAATAIDPALSLTDVDATPLVSVHVSIGTGYVNGQDVLGFTAANGITGSWDAATGTLTLTGAGTAADYEAALRTVTYTHLSDNPSTAARQVTFSVDDGTGARTATRAIQLQAVNDGPTVTTSGGALAYTEKSGAIAIDAGLSLGDVDSATLTGATVRITGQYTPGQDTLVFIAANGITGAWDAGTGTLTLSGTASLASYQAALRGVAYANGSDNPSIATRTVTLTVSDGTLTGSATRQIAIAPVDDGPQITANGMTIAQGGSAAPTITVTDVDTASAALTITATHVRGGQFTNTQTASAVTSFSYADVQAGRILFVHDGGMDAPAYTLTVSDGHASSAASTGSVNFQPILVAPPAPQPESKPDTPAAVEASEPAKETTKTETATAAEDTAGQGTLSQAEQALAMAAPGAGLESTLRLPAMDPRADAFNQARFNVDVQATDAAKPQAIAAPIIIDSFRLNWSGDLQSLINPEELRRNLDALHEQLLEQGVERRNVVASSIALTTGLSVGYVIWLVRGGALLGSMLSAMPAWQMIDPLPVLTRGRNNGGGLEDGGDDQPVEHLFDDHHDTADEPAFVEPDMTPQAAAMSANAHTAPEARP